MKSTSRTLIEDDVDHGGNHKTRDRNSSGGRGDTKSRKPWKTGGQRSREDQVRYFQCITYYVFRRLSSRHLFYYTADPRHLASAQAFTFTRVSKRRWPPRLQVTGSSNGLVPPACCPVVVAMTSVTQLDGSSRVLLLTLT